MFITPAFKADNKVCRGRAKGGLATLWHPSLTKYVSKVKCSNFRLLGKKNSFSSGNLLVINTYFPCDPRKDDFDNSELLGILADTTNLINASDCPSILIAGDLNCHFVRNTRFTNIVRNQFEDLNLNIFWEANNNKIQSVDYTHLFVSENNVSTSTIDHFVGSSRVVNCITEAGVIHHAENTSNHSPIFVKLDVGHLHVSVESCTPNPRTSWSKASEEAKNKYRAAVATKLQGIQVPESNNCNNLHCKEHTDMIANYAVGALEAVEAAAVESLPVVGGGGDGRKDKVVRSLGGMNM